MYSNNRTLRPPVESADTFPQSYATATARFDAWRLNPRTRSPQCKLAHNTVLSEVPSHDGPTVEPAYAVRLHRTDIVTFEPDGSIVLDTGGFQTPTTRDRMNRCGVAISMAGGIASVRHGGRDYTYLDDMILRPDGSAVYSNGRPAGDPAEARVQRRRALAKVRRDCARGLDSETWTWPNRSGGWAPSGNAPEARYA